MTTITHREYAIRLAHVEETWNRPSRSDYYVMLLIHVVQNLFSKRGKKFTPKDYILTFGGTRPKKLTKADKAKRLVADKSRWFGMLGFTGQE